MRGGFLHRRIWTSGALLGALLLATGCDQDPPLGVGPGAEEARLQLEFAYADETGPRAKPAADAVRVLVWHVRDLEPLPPPPAGKAAQLPDVDFDPNDWLAWAAYWQQTLGLEQIPERNERLRVEGNVAKVSLRVRAGEKHVFVGRFRGGMLTHTGEARVEALPGRMNRAVIEIASFSPEPRLEFSSEALAAAVREAAGSLLPRDVAALRSLDARARNIDDLSGVEQLTGLTALNLSGNQIEDARPLAELKALKRLDLSENRIVDVAPLAALTALTGLDLSDNRIVDVAPLALLVELTELDLSRNRIVDVGPLAALSQLARLDVRGNPLSGEAVAEQIPTLESGGLVEVLFEAPEIPEVKPELAPGEFADPTLAVEVGKALAKAFTTDVTKLKDLSISGKGISNLSGIENLTRLTRLELGDNQIRDLTPLAGMARLEVVDLSNNLITDISPLVANPGLGEGDRVDLRGNELSEEAINVQIPELQGRGVEVLYDEE